MAISTIRICPIEGKEYRSTADVRRALIIGDDFIITDPHHPSDGRYTTLRQISDEGFTHVLVCFGKHSTILSMLELQEDAL